MTLTIPNSLFLLTTFLSCIGCHGAKVSSRSFNVSYKYDCFMKDGKCFQIISGSMHYSRLPYQFWDDRLSKLAAAGLNTVKTYIPWFQHEPTEGKFNFSLNLNLTQFVNLTAKHGMYSILSTGPYIGNQLDMGGLPWWLLNKSGIKLRTSETSYMSAVDAYLEELLPKIKPMLYVNGGNVIALQIENQYGSYSACDNAYLTHLVAKYQSALGTSVILLTQDQPTESTMKCGSVKGAFPTVIFGSLTEKAVNESFSLQQNISSGGPRMNSEFFIGWYDFWGSNHSTSDVSMETLDSMWALNGSVNFHLFHGGTNLAYMAGSNLPKVDDDFQSVTTSYDYDAALSEAGDPSEKYLKLRLAINDHLHQNATPIPPASTKYKYGEVKMKYMGSIYDYLDIISPEPIKSDYPQSFEEVKHPFGYILYQTSLEKAGSNISIPGIADCGYIITNGEHVVGFLDRNQNTSVSFKRKLMAGTQLGILVENRGRISEGPLINHSKGILSNVTIDGKIVKNWMMYPINIEILFQIPFAALSTPPFVPQLKETRLPGFYMGQFTAKKLYDTYFDPYGWGRGQVFVNGYNLGRYWPDYGPQVRLYVPSVYLTETTKILMFELESTPGNKTGSPTVFLSDTPKLD